MGIGTSRVLESLLCNNEPLYIARLCHGPPDFSMYNISPEALEKMWAIFSFERCLKKYSGTARLRCSRREITLASQVYSKNIKKQCQCLETLKTTLFLEIGELSEALRLAKISDLPVYHPWNIEQLAVGLPILKNWTIFLTFAAILSHEIHMRTALRFVYSMWGDVNSNSELSMNAVLLTTKIVLTALVDLVRYEPRNKDSKKFPK